MKKKRILANIFAIGIPLGILLIILQRLIGISEQTMIMLLTIVGITIILLALIINFILVYKFNKKLNKTYKVLSEQCNPQKFIELTLEEIKNTKIRGFKSLLKINLAVGYSCLSDYEKSNKILSEMDDNYVNGINKAVYKANMAINYFIMGEDLKGKVIVETNSAIFKKYENDSRLGPSINLIYAMNSFANLDSEKGFEYMSKFKSMENDMQVLNVARVLTAREYLKMGELINAEEILSQIEEENNMPNIKTEVLKIADEINLQKSILN